jgi:hypothetical protein
MHEQVSRPSRRGPISFLYNQNPFYLEPIPKLVSGWRQVWTSEFGWLILLIVPARG